MREILEQIKENVIELYRCSNSTSGLHSPDVFLENILNLLKILEKNLEDESKTEGNKVRKKTKENS